MYIVMTGTAGDLAALKKGRESVSLLEERLAPSFISSAFRKLEGITEAAGKAGVCAGHEGPDEEIDPMKGVVPATGVFDGLWILLEAAQTGAEVYMDRIPIRQETIEICEIIGINPYESETSGKLYLWDGPSETVPEGSIIGWTNSSKGRTIRTKEGLRYMNKPGKAI